MKSLLSKKKALQTERKSIQGIIHKERERVAVSLEPDWLSVTAFHWSGRLSDLVEKVFKFNEIRQSQIEVINATMSGRNVFVVMKTGGGKSLCYQLPAFLKDGLTLVLSPLLSLIRDQTKAMNEISPGTAATIAGKQDLSEQRAVYHMIDKVLESPSGGVSVGSGSSEGLSGRLRLLFVTPEKLHKSKLLMTHLQRAYNAGKLDRIVVDEAHCASHWGRF
jgi:ATP-dependent DNA helicase Q1